MNRTILLVDDNKTERVVLSGFLNSEYKIIEAEGGEEALALLNAKSKIISAVVLDIVMPGIDGYGVLEKIRKSVIFQSIPVVVITSLDDEKTREDAIAYGANGFITKPYSRTLLLHTLQNAIMLRETSSMLNNFRRDRLTGLLNRETFFKEAERMIAGRKAGFYMLSAFDVENFKVINDQYGAKKGDEVLCHIAKSINSVMEKVSGIACRFNADRFAILYPAEFADSYMVTENHIETMQPRCINRRINIRIGRYTVNDLSLPVSAMCDRATLAEESIKGDYSRYIADYNDSMRTHLLKEQQIVNSMNQALLEGEFETWFQPQYNHATGALIGAEALVRWKRDGSYIAPSEFIPVFERNGFIYEMDRYVWNEVCRHMRTWIDEGLSPFPVSINISRRDLFHKHFITVLTDIVNKYDLPYDMIRLEVTESAFAESTGQIIAKVNELIDMGFTVEIDDFGSGYSSLNTLKDVPASILKLDMKFFENTLNTQRSGNIVESVVRMAKWIGMAVIAEGVEDKAQADYLKSIGCYYIQGYYYAHPMPLEEYEKLFTAAEKETQLTRLKTLETLDNSEFWNPKSLETLIFNSYVGGACIFEFYNERSELLRVNEQYTREMGSLIEVGARLKESSMVRFLDDEGRAALIDAIHRAIDEKKEASCEVVLRNKNHVEYVRVTLRNIASAAERHLLYAAIVNMTEKRTMEEKLREMLERAGDAVAAQTELLDNLPSGAALYEYDGKKISVIHINKSYWQIVEREEVDYSDCSLLEVVHDDDRAAAMEEVTAAIEQNRNIDINVRILCGKSDYRPFHIEAKVARKESGKYLFFTSYTPISDISNLDFELNTLLNVIPSGVLKYAADESESFAYINRNFIESLGYSEEGFKKKFHNCFREMVYEGDRERAENEVIIQEGAGGIGKFEYRIEDAQGKLRWFHDEGVKVTDREGKQWYYVTLTEVTNEQEERERLRISEEFNRIAIEQSGSIITKFDVEKRTLTLPDSFNPIFVLPHILKNMPEEQIALGRISPDTADEYRKLFNSIIGGAASGKALYKQNSTRGWRWLEAQFTTLFSDTQKSVSAVISFNDVTERLEKEVVYNKWQQSLDERDENSYALFRCNLSRGTSFDSWEGKLLNVKFQDGTYTFDERTREYIEQCVYKGDRARYGEFLNSDGMLAAYYRGHRADSIEYREEDEKGNIRWLKLSVDLVEYPSSRDVEAYLMYENIDEKKKADLLTLERSQTDPLTGVLNRAAFASKMNEILKTSLRTETHALLMLDIDDFKKVNDNFGHGAGDEVLKSLTENVRLMLRHDDLLGRMGGDEFFVFLKGIPTREAAAVKAEQICNLKITTHGVDVAITASIGIAMLPKDGRDFDTLYEKVDAALYNQKAHGKNGYKFAE